MWSSEKSSTQHYGWCESKIFWRAICFILSVCNSKHTGCRNWRANAYTQSSSQHHIHTYLIYLNVNFRGNLWDLIMVPKWRVCSIKQKSGFLGMHKLSNFNLNFLTYKQGGIISLWGPSKLENAVIEYIICVYIYTYIDYFSW